METCSVDGCDRTHYAKKLCALHYARRRRTGHVGPAHLIDRTGVSLDRTEYSNEIATCVCGTEFRQRATGSPKRYCSPKCKSRYEKKAQRSNGKPVNPRSCSVHRCEKPHAARGFCVMHYERVKKYGEPGEPESRRRPGVWRPSRDGYLYAFTDGKKRLQHRAILEQHLGRDLLPTETVHHKNGDRSDNRIENLELWSSAQPSGQRVADKLAWAREIIALYGDAPTDVL